MAFKYMKKKTFCFRNDFGILKSITKNCNFRDSLQSHKSVDSFIFRCTLIIHGIQTGAISVFKAAIRSINRFPLCRTCEVLWKQRRQGTNVNSRLFWEQILKFSIHKNVPTNCPNANGKEIRKRSSGIRHYPEFTRYFGCTEEKWAYMSCASLGYYSGWHIALVLSRKGYHLKFVCESFGRYNNLVYV